MILVGLLTETQKNELIGGLYNQDSYFNPVQMLDGSWIISTEEINFCINPQFDWVKTLPLVEWTGNYIVVSGSTNND